MNSMGGGGGKVGLVLFGKIVFFVKDKTTGVALHNRASTPIRIVSPLFVGLRQFAVLFSV